MAGLTREQKKPYPKVVHVSAVNSDIALCGRKHLPYKGGKNKHPKITASCPKCVDLLIIARNDQAQLIRKIDMHLATIDNSITSFYGKK